MHGGNAGSSVAAPPIDESGREVTRDPDGVVDGREEKYDVVEKRLDDFWRMKLERCATAVLYVLASETFTMHRPSPEEIVRKATFEVRRQQ
jgi:hypothetical protein